MGVCVGLSVENESQTFSCLTGYSLPRDFTPPAKVPALAAPCLPQPSQQKEIEQLAPIALLSDLFMVSKALDVRLGPAVRLSPRKQDEELTARALGTSTLV